MGTQTLADKRITLHYPDPNAGTFNFSNVAITASDAQCYTLANVLNSFQADPMSKVTVREEFVIV